MPDAELGLFTGHPQRAPQPQSCNHRPSSHWPYPVSSKTLSVFQGRQNRTVCHTEVCSEERFLTFNNTWNQKLTHWSLTPQISPKPTSKETRVESCLLVSRLCNKAFSLLKSQCHSTGFYAHWTVRPCLLTPSGSSGAGGPVCTCQEPVATFHLSGPPVL